MNDLDKYFQNHDNYDFFCTIKELSQSIQDQAEPEDIQVVINKILENTKCNSQVLKKARQMKFKIDNLHSNKEYTTTTSIIKNTISHYKSALVLINKHIAVICELQNKLIELKQSVEMVPLHN